MARASVLDDPSGSSSCRACSRASPTATPPASTPRSCWRPRPADGGADVAVAERTTAPTATPATSSVRREPASPPSHRGVPLPAPGRWRRRRPPTPAAVSGVARVDRRTKDLVKRLRPGDIAVIDHDDLDRVAAERLVDAAPAAVVNASPSITGRYPNVGPLLLCRAGIPLVDDVGDEVMDAVVEGARSPSTATRCWSAATVVAPGTRQIARHASSAALDDARGNLGAELERFAGNTAEYIRQESHLLIDELDVPELDFRSRAGTCSSSCGASTTRRTSRCCGSPATCASCGPCSSASTAAPTPCSRSGASPTSSSATSTRCPRTRMRCGAQLVVHGYPDGRAPGAERLDDLGLPTRVFAARARARTSPCCSPTRRAPSSSSPSAPTTPWSSSSTRAGPGMASTFLVRMKVGPILVDAKGVSRLYRHPVRKWDLVCARGRPLHAARGAHAVRARPAVAPRLLALAHLRLMINFRYHIVSLIAVFLALGRRAPPRDHGPRRRSGGPAQGRPRGPRERPRPGRDRNAELQRQLDAFEEEAGGARRAARGTPLRPAAPRATGAGRGTAGHRRGAGGAGDHRAGPGRRRRDGHLVADRPPAAR